jgi:hypothetical protein
MLTDASRARTIVAGLRNFAGLSLAISYFLPQYQDYLSGAISYASVDNPKAWFLFLPLGFSLVSLFVRSRLGLILLLPPALFALLLAAYIPGDFTGKSTLLSGAYIGRAAVFSYLVFTAIEVFFDTKAKRRTPRLTQE